MPVIDIKSQKLQTLAGHVIIISDTTTTTAITDTANNELGWMFSVAAINYTDGTYDFIIEDGNDAALADAAIVPDEKIIGSLANLTLTATNVSGDTLNTVGVFSTKRYLRVSVVSTLVTTGASILVNVTQAPEVSKV